MAAGGSNILQVGMLNIGELLDNKWYYFDDQGWMKSNEWINPGGKWYYLSNDGAMLTGYNRVGGTPYFFRTSGDLVENKRRSCS